ncbi:hypothetical protein [Streptomyces lavendulae]|uniref:hypothetical protein n=1 Tax=Streptomyces lavendulae TaxID=1914 RepID=UPI0036A7FAFE
MSSLSGYDRAIGPSCAPSSSTRNGKEVGETDGTCTATRVDNAITGGTGMYDRARGSVRADTIGTGTRRFTIGLDR